jgi:hypothetical protein
MGGNYNSWQACFFLGVGFLFFLENPKWCLSSEMVFWFFRNVENGLSFSCRVKDKRV